MILFLTIYTWYVILTYLAPISYFNLDRETCFDCEEGI